MLKLLLNRIKQLNRKQKQLLMIIADICLIPIALWISLSLRLSNLWPVQYFLANIEVIILIPILSIPLFIHYGLYRAVLKYMGYQVIVATVKAVTLSSLSFGTLLMFIRDIYFPRSTIIIFWFVSILIIIASRYLMKSILYFKDPMKKPIALYGAGEAGFQLIDSLRSSFEYMPVALFDDSPSKWGTVVNSMQVYPGDDLGEIIKKKNIKLILLSILGISRSERRQILHRISKFPVQVRMIASIDNLISGNFNLEQIHSVDVEDILGRDAVNPDVNLLEKNIKNKNILVTGAGGSIGKELCKQIILLKPKLIVLYENNEYSLYKTHLELNVSGNYIKIIPILSSVLNSLKFQMTLREYDINTVYHAAAYKHVPLVEMNPLDGINNNIIGTYNCVKGALETSVDTFILISTDKAVRPSNIMGATKRFSELILQGAQKLSSGTCFSMVRFGNVLDSAGSVVPLFRSQIKKGGPITVTHPEVTRYFMSIPEAVELVIQAGALARGGEVFVLEMGDPIRIIDLAKQMIHLSGFEHKTDKSPNGDIGIKITGLRPGEKLNEELIIGNNVYSTDHPQILKAKETSFEWNPIEEKIANLKTACEAMDINTALEILKGCVTEWNPDMESDYYSQSDSYALTNKKNDIAEC